LSIATPHHIEQSPYGVQFHLLNPHCVIIPFSFLLALVVLSILMAHLGPSKYFIRINLQTEKWLEVRLPYRPRLLGPLSTYLRCSKLMSMFDLTLVADVHNATTLFLRQGVPTVALRFPSEGAGRGGSGGYQDSGLNNIGLVEYRGCRSVPRRWGVVEFDEIGSKYDEGS
ncbi:hypothetical protein Tco_0401881, partial [Tanacetum coccineum]